MLKKQEEIVYDYIIAGSGCAGLSLLYRLINEPILKNKKILVIDKEAKTTNDRTWCFWETGEGLFENIVAHQWKNLEFKTSSFAKTFHLNQYSYKMIKGLDFYKLILNTAKDYKNVTFKFENIEKIEADSNYAKIKTEKGNYLAEFIFNSTPIFNPKMDSSNSLLQHFEGWVIRTNKATFNSEIGTLMDFSLSQKHGTTFMYVLPTSAHEALIEYTLFTEKLLDKKEYKVELERYIKEDLKIDDYEILHEEFGIIPMSLAKFSRNPNTEKRIVNIGTAGGFTKASSGYTFQFIQKNTKEIINNLLLGKSPSPKITFRDKMYQWYDSTVLEVIISKKMQGKDIFSKMFKKLSIVQILKFLGNESTIIDDFKTISSLPIKPFLIAGIKRLMK